MLADTLRKSGDTHKLIFGLNLPQITDIANRFTANAEVATELWNSTDTRECRLIAPMLYPITQFNENTALLWISQIENIEIADNMCHKLLKKLTFAPDLCNRLSSGNDIERYTALRLAINLLAMRKDINIEHMQLIAMVEADKPHCITSLVAQRLLEDIQEYVL